MDKPLVDTLSFVLKKDDRVAVIGKNGRGKSTLLKLLAGELQPRSGEIVNSPNTSLSFFAQTNTNRLKLSNTIETEIHQVNEKLGRTAVRAICGCMMFEGDDALKKISVLSGGERSRVLLGKILATPSNVLLLDEPTNHLDVESVMSLTDALEDFEGGVVIVTHNEDILRRVAKRLIIFQGERPFLFEGTYDEFLDSIGWEEEESLPQRSRKKDKPSAAKGREQKREKAEVLQERSRQMTPLREEVSRLEKGIASLEREVAGANEKLAQASASGDSAMIQSTSQVLARVQKDLAERLAAWEAAVERVDTLERSFAEQLTAFD
jgi:ATP-binding cassette subfamily F protein 3